VFAFWRQDPRWRISAILDFRGPITGSLKRPCTTSYRSSIESIALNCLLLRKSRFSVTHFGDRKTSRWRISAILDFRSPIMASLKSPCTTSYRSSIETIPLNCLLFEKIAFFLHFGDRQTDKQMDSIDA